LTMFSKVSQLAKILAAKNPDFRCARATKWCAERTLRRFLSFAAFAPLREIFRFFWLRLCELALGIQDLAADFDRFGVDQDESDHTRLSAAIEPVVDRAALHEHVARL
jgi:hypothetical protein